MHMENAANRRTVVTETYIPIIRGRNTGYMNL